MKKLFVIMFIVFATIWQIEAQQFQWAMQFNGETKSGTSIIKASANGNIFIAGSFNGTIDFDGGNGTTNLTSIGENDLFIEKTDMAGNLIWVKQIGGVDDEFVRGMSIDANENIYLVGSFKSTIDLDPGDGEVLYTSYGDWDIFVLELDANGDYLWSGQMGGTSADYGVNIDLANSGNIYISGYFAGVGDFDPAPDQEHFLTASYQSCFVEKLNSANEFVWVGGMGGPGIDYLEGMYIDSDENIYTTGAFAGPADFDPGDGTQILNSIGDRDIFISKLNTNGEYVLAASMGGADIEMGQSITADAENNIYITGNFKGMVDFDPDPNEEYYLSSMGDYDIFIGKFSPEANLIWMKQIGGVGNDSPYRITLDGENNVYTTGLFEETVDFDPGDGEYFLSSAGDIDFYLNKLDNNGVHEWAVGIGSTGYDRGYTLFCLNNFVYSGGVFSGSVDFDPSEENYILNGVGEYNGFVYKLETTYVGMDEISSNEEMSIYPNPTSSTTNIYFNDKEFSGKIEVFNILGEKIINKNINVQNVVNLKLGNNKGLFFVKITNSIGEEKIIKLIKE